LINKKWKWLLVYKYKNFLYITNMIKTNIKIKV
jgi:hypothetical protein